MIIEKQEKLLSYYLGQGKMSDPGPYLSMLQTFPEDVPSVVRTLQGLVLHIFWAERYEVNLPDLRKEEVNLRPVQEKMKRLLEVDSRLLTQARPPELRLIGNCRDFSLLMAAILKVKGIPARARCGFGTYFMPGHYEDHWMTEYWLASEQRWVQVDAQLDDLQKSVLGISFDSLDMPKGQFILAGEAWQMARAGKANPDDFGIFQWHGWDFIKGNVMRDLLSLNRIEMLPWDDWGLMTTPVAESTGEQMALIDRAAELTLAGNEAFDEMQAFYTDNEVFHVTDL